MLIIVAARDLAFSLILMKELTMVRNLFLSGVLIVLTAAAVQAEAKHGLKSGTPDLAAAGALAFGPDGIAPPSSRSAR